MKELSVTRANTEFYPIVSEENGSSFLLPARKKKKVVSEGEGVKVHNARIKQLVALQPQGYHFELRVESSF
jgi:hypothetical protein